MRVVSSMRAADCSMLCTSGSMVWFTKAAERSTNRWPCSSVSRIGFSICTSQEFDFETKTVTVSQG